MPRLTRFKYDEWARWTHEQVLKDAPDVIAFDTETEGVGFYDRAFGATVTWRSPAGELRNGYFELEGEGREARIERFGGTLRSVPTWVAHNAKFDGQKILLIGAITWDDLGRHRIEDTQTLAHLLNENRRKALKSLAVTELGWDDTIMVETKSGPNKGKLRPVPREEHRLAQVRKKLNLTKDDGYHLLPREVLIPYALRDTDFTLLLYEKLKPQLEAQDDGLQALYEQELQLMYTLLRMEARGLALDLEYLDQATSEYGVKVMEGWNRVVEITKNPELNPQSPAQLKAAFKKRGLNLESTAEAVLKGLDDELARAILEYRSDKKIHTTYLTALQKEQRNGIVHPHFNATGAKTGRTSSSSARA